MMRPSAARPPRLAAALLLALGACAPARAQPAERSASEPPRLVVFITVDQLIPEYFARYERQLTGGLGRLYRGGAVFTDAHQDHGVTETAPGHASTLSGRFPRSTGIVSNALGVEDPQAPLVGGGGPPASPFRFRGGTLVDWMRVADPRSRSLSVSRKDRGAILPVGRAGRAVFWYALDAGRFTTSAWYADTLPDWVERFNARHPVSSFAGRAWTLLLPEREYPEPDSVPAESGGRNFVFPHVVPTDPAQVAPRLADFPWVDSLTLRLALDGLREMRLGAGPSPDLLAVSLSATDAVGHRFGPDSREIHDQVLRLDRWLGAFMDSVYATVDPPRVVFALTADHGVNPFPEVRPGGEAARAYHVDVQPLVRGVRAALAAAGADTTAFEWDDGVVYLRRDRLRGTNIDADTLIAGFAERVRRVPGVLRADRMRDLRALPAEALERDRIAGRWVHMIPADFPVELVVTQQPRHVWGPRTSATHGSPHDYDTHVPLIFYGPAIRPGRYAGYVRVVDIAPTLARILGVAPTEALDGRVLQPALR
ncbi:MAG TPA: alkaline phosphatase family protein [Longimicrobium sp.]|nr:alkaline phosphatase family protein [Longimicrobium sp.]